MDKLEILERYYKAFIGKDKPREFFLGLGDYIDYGETLPEFDAITTALSKQAQPLVDERKKKEEAALSRLVEIKKRIADYLSAYLSARKISSPEIDQWLKQFDDFLYGRADMDGGPAYGMIMHLGDVIKHLYDKWPELQSFAAKYIDFLELRSGNKAVRKYIQVPEFDALCEIDKRLERERSTSLWGQQWQLYQVYKAMKEGRERYKNVVERHKRGEAQATREMLNYSVILYEWTAIEEGGDNHDGVCFVVDRIRPAAERFHTHVVAQWERVEERRRPQEDTILLKKLDFSHQIGLLKLIDQNDIEHDIPVQGQVQREILRVIFQSNTDAYSEWSLYDISEILGPDDVGERAVKNALYQFNRKVQLEIPALKNLFVLTKHSARIDQKYLIKT